MGQPVPSLAGVLDAPSIEATAASIAALQEADGAIPFALSDLHMDVWDHVEGAMGLLAGGQFEAADRAYAWLLDNQRDDGSFARRITRGQVEEDAGDANMTAYVAVGVWHHWLLRQDLAFVHEQWPVVRRALDWVTSLQLPWGGIAWLQPRDEHGSPAEPVGEALLTGSSSMYQALRCGLAIAELVGERRPAWAEAAGFLRHAVCCHRDRFEPKTRFAMDWYYPVLAGPVRGAQAVDLIEARWNEFVDPQYGVRCVVENRWLTGAETCELAICLEAIGRHDAGVALLESISHLRAEDGSYWTGYALPEDVFYPEQERSTFTAAAVILATEALSDTTPGADIFRGETLPEIVAMPTRGCGCL